jgi:hypothetical protein
LLLVTHRLEAVQGIGFAKEATNMLDHFVAFGASEEDQAAIGDALHEFAGAIASLECVMDISWGKNSSASGVERGVTYGCFVRLTSQEALRSEYWNHPAHQKLLSELNRRNVERFAVDYPTKAD